MLKIKSLRETLTTKNPRRKQKLAYKLKIMHAYVFQNILIAYITGFYHLELK